MNTDTHSDNFETFPGINKLIGSASVVDHTPEHRNETRAVCNICVRSASNPFRVYDEHGNVTEGCVSSFHTGHLINISESNRWHMRKEAKAIRRNLAAIKFHRMRAPYI